ncbi:carbamoyltransferase [Alphaproteobacteria bacterium]|nr:carbamoyltransferase [Alphaproteobacteria bacterium]
MFILGISSFYHDSAASLISNGEIIAAAQEERFTRKKHDPSFPINSIKYCLSQANINASEIDRVIFYDNPLRTFTRLIATYFSTAPFGYQSFRQAIPTWLGGKLFLKNIIQREIKSLSSNFNAPILFCDHHLSHAAAAFFPSPFEEAAVLTVDGVGEWATTTTAIGIGSQLKIDREIHFPHSLGLLYSAFTSYSGFKVNSGEYKLMGLAPYGEPRFEKKIKENLIDIKDDGSFRLDQSYFDYCGGLRMTNPKFDMLFGKSSRSSEEEITQFHMDIAASIQKVTETVVLSLTRDLAKRTSKKNLCMAGGVALNCVANGKILKDGSFENLWIQPAAGDAGGSLGAALVDYHINNQQDRANLNGSDNMKGSYLGPEFCNKSISEALISLGAIFEEFGQEELIEKTAEALSHDQAIGWFQGRMEFGPRALGGRSILANPMSEKMQKTLNLKVKYRESFRPFAPSILIDDVQCWFQLETDSPYMLLVAELNEEHRYELTTEENNLFGIEKLNIPRSKVPAITHVDYTARVQTVENSTNPLYFQLLSQFKKITNCPILVNTSFNVRGEPIVCSPVDAFKCFMGTELDVLAIGNFILHKSKQNKDLLLDYKNSFELD